MIHLPARAWPLRGLRSHFSAQDLIWLRQLAAAGAPPALGLSFYPLEDWLTVRDLGYRDLVIRLWHDRNELPPVRDHFAAYAPYLRRLADEGIRPAIVALNEPNLELAALGPARVAAWLEEWVDLCRRGLPQHELVSPALSPSTPDALAWLDALEQAFYLHDSLGLHCYWSPSSPAEAGVPWSPEWLRARFPQHQVRLTECGGADGTSRQYRRQTYPTLLSRWAKLDYVRSCHVFVMSAEDPRWERLGHTYDQSLVELFCQLAPQWSHRKEVAVNTPLWLAIIPSNQDRNPVVGGSNEMAQVVPFARTVYDCARSHTAISARLFIPAPESADRTPYEGLWAVQREAAAWLRQAPKGTLTVSLNLHSDSGLVPHVGGYFSRADGDVSQRLALDLAQVLGRLFGCQGAVWTADYTGYIFAQAMRGVAAPVLLELGSHQVPEQVRYLAENGELIAQALVTRLLNFFGLPANVEEAPAGGSPASALNWEELRRYAVWAGLRCDHREDPRDREAFRAYIAATGGDAGDLRRYGWPC